jgi:hypothetical protein
MAANGHPPPVTVPPVTVTAPARFLSSRPAAPLCLCQAAGPPAASLACVVGHILRPAGNMPAIYNKQELHMGWRPNNRAHSKLHCQTCCVSRVGSSVRVSPLLSLRIGCTTSRGRGAWHEIEARTAENTRMRAMALSASASPAPRCLTCVLPTADRTFSAWTAHSGAGFTAIFSPFELFFR